CLSALNICWNMLIPRLNTVARSLPSNWRGMSLATSLSRQPFLLYTAGTPNGHKELKALYGLEYDVHAIDISKNTQKEPWFIKLNPNGRIPVLVDRNRANFTVFETAAILLSSSSITTPSWRSRSTRRRARTIIHGGIGPMQGQANHFLRFAREDIPYAKNRYLNETKRLYGVLDIRLTGRDWLAGPERGKYSVADINALPWVSRYDFTGIESLDPWPNVKAWVERGLMRPAVKAGMQIP
ncbi:Disulfide-bond oxidoreductase YfcG, partial [Grifola frondosa]